MQTINYNGTTFKVGDEVKIVREVEYFCKDGMGEGKMWKNSWVDYMTYSIGKTGKIETIHKTQGVRIEGMSFYGYPLMALELVKKPKFKVGDVIHCVNACGWYQVENSGVPITVVWSGFNSVGEDMVGISAEDPQWYASRFELVEDTKPAPNGVDAQGNALHFTTDNLDNWMRVTVENGYEYVVAKTDNLFYVRNGAWVGDIGDEGWELTEVYAAPEPYQYLDVNAKGSLIWKRPPPKTAEQLAQDAAVAARNKAIEEAENALKLRML